jgi:hypothetical protein
MTVGIYQIDRGISIWIWLCAGCVKARKAAGWAVKEKKPPPHDGLHCQDCDSK